MYASNLYPVIRTQIRDNLSGIKDTWIDYSPEGKPFPSSGQWFVAITDGSWSSRPYESAQRYYTYGVVVTLRLSQFPVEEYGDRMLELMDKSEAIADILDRNLDIASSWESAINKSDISTRGFNVFQSASAPIPRFAEWFSGGDYTGVHTASDRYAGYSVSMKFRSPLLAKQFTC